MASSSRIGCLFVPEMPLCAQLRAEPELLGQEVGVFEKEASRPGVVQAVSREARLAGVIPGMGVPQARGLSPGMILRPLDPARVRSAQAALMDVARSFSPRVTLVVSSRPNFSRIAPYVPVKHGSIVIDNDAWLGTGVVVLPNVTIGEGSVVAANSVVNKDVKPYTIVGGSPAKMICEVSVPWIEETKSLVP